MLVRIGYPLGEHNVSGNGAVGIEPDVGLHFLCSLPVTGEDHGQGAVDERGVHYDQFPQFGMGFGNHGGSVGGQ